MALKKILLALMLIVFGSTIAFGGTIKSDSNGFLTFNDDLICINEGSYNFSSINNVLYLYNSSSEIEIQNSFSNNQHIILKEGIYYLNEELNLDYNNMILECENKNTILKLNNYVNTSIFNISGNHNQILGCSLDGRNNNLSLPYYKGLVTIWGDNNVITDNIGFLDNGVEDGDVVRVEWTGNFNTIENNDLHGGRNGIWTYDDSIIVNNYIDNATNLCIKSRVGERNIISENNCQNSGSGIGLSGEYGVGYSDYNIITNNVVKDLTSGSGLNIYVGRNNIIDGNIVEGSPTQACIRLEGASYNQINDITCDNVYYGIRISDDATGGSGLKSEYNSFNQITITDKDNVCQYGLKYDNTNDFNEFRFILEDGCITHTDVGSSQVGFISSFQTYPKILMELYSNINSYPTMKIENEKDNYGLQISQTDVLASGKNALYVGNNIAQTSSNLITFEQTNLGTTQGNVKIRQDGTNYGLWIDMNNNGKALTIDSSATGYAGITLNDMSSDKAIEFQEGDRVCFNNGCTQWLKYNGSCIVTNSGICIN